MKHVTHWCQALFFLVITAFTIGVGATPIRITSANEVVIYFPESVTRFERDRAKSLM